MKDSFSEFHPAVTFSFFIEAVIFGMIFTQPVMVCISLFSAALYYLLLKGRKGIKTIRVMLILLAVLCLVNPLLNSNGDTVLFTYLNGRRFTLESLLYGLMTGGMFVTVLLWFSCYNIVMTSDKFIFLFGRFVPAISLLLSMVLRLIPNLQEKNKLITGARKCIGKALVNGSKKEKLQNGMDNLSALTSWALEGAVTTADSMKSRGYGSGVRTHYAIYIMTFRDRVVMGIMFLGIVFTISGAALGERGAVYFPALRIAAPGVFTVLSWAGYTVFLLLPSIIHVWEEATWRILKLKI